METADILKAITNVDDHERRVISEDKVICKFPLDNPATSTTVPENKGHSRWQEW